MKSIVIAAFYKFSPLPDFKDLRPKLQRICDQNSIKGTILLAKEGINATVAGPRTGIDTLLTFLKSDQRLADLEWKESYDNTHPFYHMKVRLKKEIVTLGVEGADPNQQVGKYVDPEKWNDLMTDPEVVLVDTRNDYEYELGTFKGALNPKTKTFRQFPEFVKKNLDRTRHKKVAMFCTGGIRCEKATSYLLKQGFEEAYHLKGGILKYLEVVPKEKSFWNGECFVFDNRVTVDSDLNQGHYELCHACREPISENDKTSGKFEAGISCPRCFGKIPEKDLARFKERALQVRLARQRGKSHFGPQRRS